ncbi:MAG: hypothetical protein HAW61_05525 [Candidatus Portiera sp.]|nr:hypothetical protein [Portiera sp.]
MASLLAACGNSSDNSSGGGGGSSISQRAAPVNSSDTCQSMDESNVDVNNPSDLPMCQTNVNVTNVNVTNAKITSDYQGELIVNLTFAAGLLDYEPTSRIGFAVLSYSGLVDLTRFSFPLDEETLRRTNYFSTNLGNFTSGKYVMEATIFHADGRPMLRRTYFFDIVPPPIEVDDFNTANSGNSIDTNNKINPLKHDITLPFNLDYALFPLNLGPDENDKTTPDTNLPTNQTGPDTSGPVNQTDPDTSESVNQTDPDTSGPVNQTDPDTSEPANQTDPDTSQPTNQTTPDTNLPTNQTGPDTSGPVNQTDPDTSESVNQTDPDTSEPANQTGPDTSGPVNQTGPDTSESVNQTTPDTNLPTNQTGPDTSESVNQTGPDTSQPTNQTDIKVSLNLLDTDGDGKLEIFHPAQLAALSYQQLNISRQMYSSYELTSDLDLSSYDNWHPIGNETIKFRGEFDGNGYMISGLNTSGYKHAGLFGFSWDAMFDNIRLQVGTVQGTHHAGALIGRARFSQISNTEVILGDKNIQTNGTYVGRVGGLIGYLNESQLYNSSVTGAGTISANYNSHKKGGLEVGGLVGKSDGSRLINNSIEGNFNITANVYMGDADIRLAAFVGESSRTFISDANIDISGSISSYSNKSHPGDNYVGLLIGYSFMSHVTNANISWHSSSDALSIINTKKLRGAILIGRMRHGSISDINAYIQGDINIKSEVYRKNNFNFVSDADNLNILHNINIKLEGNLNLDVPYIYLSSFNYKFYSSQYGVANISVNINGDISMGNPDYLRQNEYRGNNNKISFAGLCAYYCFGSMTNISLIINGNMDLYANNAEVYWGNMFVYAVYDDDYYDDDIYQYHADKSSVFINGSINMHLHESDLYFEGLGLDYHGFNNLSINNSYVHITGDTNINASFSENALSGSDTSHEDRIHIDMLNNKLPKLIPVHISNSYVAMDQPLAIYINDELSPQYFNTSIESIYNNTIDSFYHSMRALGSNSSKANAGDTNGPTNQITDTTYRDYVQLRCPTNSINELAQSCGGLPSDKSTYTNWDQSIWDFGDNATLPILRNRY